MVRRSGFEQPRDDGVPKIVEPQSSEACGIAKRAPSRQAALDDPLSEAEFQLWADWHSARRIESTLSSLADSERFKTTIEVGQRRLYWGRPAPMVRWPRLDGDAVASVSNPRTCGGVSESRGAAPLVLND
jgi:hypothetical protein